MASLSAALNAVLECTLCDDGPSDEVSFCTAAVLAKLFCSHGPRRRWSPLL